MSFPEPQPGLVIRYSYLWASEAEQGREEGVKDRPCAVILVTQDAGGKRRVLVLPITHAAPADPAMAVEIPAATKARLGLDFARSWIVLTELNDFIWPGPDLRPLAGGDAGSVAFGMLPPGFFRLVRERFLALARALRVEQVPRTE
ncbi:hypothetical protein [Azorhizobium doebereinerae]|uniref:hypothetical protein n=1 Tax=Azorhizobium doebereinerae TaxID=281091 RepID=UPI000421C377|nr:hypothetical protein [Azorhizobium doebereinerae]